MAPSPSPRRLIDVLPAMELPIQFDRDRVVAFCRERGIVRLSVFGSVLRDDFDPAHSDIDVLSVGAHNRPVFGARPASK